MVLAVVGDPADRPAFRGTGSDDRQNVFEPAGPQRETAVSQQAMIGQADPDPAGQPVQEDADGQPRPGKKGRHKSKEGKSVQGPDPDQGSPGQPYRRGSRGGRCRHDQPLVVIIAEDGFVVVGGPGSNRRDSCSRHTPRHAVLPAGPGSRPESLACESTKRSSFLDGRLGCKSGTFGKEVID